MTLAIHNPSDLPVDDPVDLMAREDLMRHDIRQAQAAGKLYMSVFRKAHRADGAASYAGGWDELAQLMGAKNSTVRSAMSLLERKGLCVNVTPHGSRTSPLTIVVTRGHGRVCPEELARLSQLKRQREIDFAATAESIAPAGEDTSRETFARNFRAKHSRENAKRGKGLMRATEGGVRASDTETEALSDEAGEASFAAAEQPPRNTKRRRLPKRAPVSADDVKMPASLDTIEAREALAEWLGYKADIGKPYRKIEYVQTLLENHAANGAEVFVAAVKHSIGNGWQGLFAPNEGRKNKCGRNPIRKGAFSYDPTATSDFC